jgi:hypothetical protein
VSVNVVSLLDVVQHFRRVAALSVLGFSVLERKTL